MSRRCREPFLTVRGTLCRRCLFRGRLHLSSGSDPDVQRSENYTGHRRDRRRALEGSPRDATPPVDRARHDHEVIGRRRNYRRWFRSGVTRSIGRCAQQLKPSLYTERTVEAGDRWPVLHRLRPNGGRVHFDGQLHRVLLVLRSVVEVVRWRADTRHVPHPNASRAKASRGRVPAQRGGYDERQRPG